MNGSKESLLDARKIYAIIKKNWLVLSRDKTRLVMMMMFPLVMIIIFGYTAGRVPTNVSGGIVDYDNSLASWQVQQLLYSSDIFSIKHVYGSQDEGKKALEAGEVKMLFIIPAGFEKDVQAGKTATITTILDESDPTVAQITRGSIQALVQGISDQFRNERLAAMSSGALEAKTMLTSACPSFDSSAQLSRIQSTFTDARQVFSGTNALLSGAAQSLGNAIGPVGDPNAAAASINNGTAGSAGLALLATSAGKQPLIDQLAFYQGIQGLNARLYQDAALIYSDSNAVYANSLQSNGALHASCSALNSAGAQFGEIADSAAKASSEAVVVSEIEPYGTGRTAMDFLLPSILALIVFQGAVMGMGRAIAGERKDGSLTRVFLTPTSNTTILSGTLLFYMLFETVRSSIMVFIAIIIFGVVISGNVAYIVFLIWLYAAGCTGLGMIFSVLSKSEQQYMALSMLVSLPTMFLAGVFLPIETMPSVLQGVAHILPVTYASDALRGIMIKGFSLAQVVPDMAFLAAFAVITLTISVMLFKRELI